VTGGKQQRKQQSSSGKAFFDEVLANANNSHYTLVMVICLCHRVTEGDITKAVRQGCASFDELQDELLVGRSCGACADYAHQHFHEQARACCGFDAALAGQMQRARSV